MHSQEPKRNDSKPPNPLEFLQKQGILFTEVLPFAFILLSWLLAAAFVPTFDFDEALYLRIAEEMKKSGEYLLPQWDGKPVFDKPPLFMWLIVLTSKLLGDPEGKVSMFAARLPGLLFSLGTALLICREWLHVGMQMFDPPIRRDSDLSTAPDWKKNPLLPFFCYAALLLPSVGASSVLLDPMLTFFLTPVFLVLVRKYIFPQQHIRMLPNENRKQQIVAGIGMGLAVCSKGLIGIVVPALALLASEALQLLYAKYQTSDHSDSENSQFFSRVQHLAREHAFSFVLALGIGFAFYFTIVVNGGEKFVSEFFITHHFKRGSTAFEGHGGGPHYHPLVVLLGGTGLVGFALHLLSSPNVRFNLRKESFWIVPAGWIFAFVFFFSLMATKLPNYTWPVWPALAYFVSLLMCYLFSTKMRVNPEEETTSTRWVSNILSYLSAVCGILIPFLLGCAFLAAPVLLNGFPAFFRVDFRARFVLHTLQPIPQELYIGLFLVGLAFLFLARTASLYRQNTEFEHQDLVWVIKKLALGNAFIIVSLALFVAPFAKEKVVGPAARLAEKATNLLKGDEKLATIGLYSPTVSSHARVPVQQYGKFDTTPLNLPGGALIILPVWLETQCTAQGGSVVAEDQFLLLCRSKTSP